MGRWNGNLDACLVGREAELITYVLYGHNNILACRHVTDIAGGQDTSGACGEDTSNTCGLSAGYWCAGIAGRERDERRCACVAVGDDPEGAAVVRVSNSVIGAGGIADRRRGLVT